MYVRLMQYTATVLVVALGYTVSHAQIIPSTGLPGLNPVFNGEISPANEWNGAHTFNIDEGGGDPLVGNVRAFHKGDGIYLFATISDPNPNNNDALWIRFDMNHNASGSTEATDWGIEVYRNNPSRWGPANQDPSTWTGSPNDVGVHDDVNTWNVELKVPTGATTGLDLSVGTVGVYFAIFNVDSTFSSPAAKYTQWPAPTTLNAVNNNTPSAWGDYIFDPATTFPDLSITNVRNGYDGSENYRKVSHTQKNLFQVELNNPGGTAVADAEHVRLNLYLAARGIGESWHRLDEEALIDADCALPTWPSNFINKSEVCSGNTSHDDISAQSINDVVNNTAEYTTKNGQPMNRLGGQDMTATGGNKSWVNVLEWDTTNPQDGFYSEVDIGSGPVRRQHQCMKAEAIYANDPNPSNNTRQVNMDFVCVPGNAFKAFTFTLGFAGFGKYDPGIGKEMFLQARWLNVDPDDKWVYELEGAEQIDEDRFVAKLEGERSRVMKLNIAGPGRDVFGKVLKANLMVPPQAGALIAQRDTSMMPPVYVKIDGGVQVVIAHYGLNDRDEQYVDLDGLQEGPLPPNGPSGLLDPYARRVEGRLLVPDAPPGSLVGSFDNFQTGFAIGAGVQALAPGNARYLALAINDGRASYKDNGGTGFRVKVTQRAPDARRGGFSLDGIRNALAQDEEPSQKRPRTIVPINDVMPTLCFHGYENIEEKRELQGAPHELYRHIGRVCWGVINVYDEAREEEDEPDPFEPDGKCGYGSASSMIFSFFLIYVGLIVMQRRRRSSSSDLV